MAVREDCRHFLLRSTAGGDSVRRCRVGANQEEPFACPEGCLFFEPRKVSGAGWSPAPTQPMSNTAHGLPEIPQKRRGPKKGWGKGGRRR